MKPEDLMSDSGSNKHNKTVPPDSDQLENSAHSPAGETDEVQDESLEEILLQELLPGVLFQGL